MATVLGRGPPSEGGCGSYKGRLRFIRMAVMAKGGRLRATIMLAVIAKG